MGENSYYNAKCDAVGHEPISLDAKQMVSLNTHCVWDCDFSLAGLFPNGIHNIKKHSQKTLFHSYY